MPASKKTWIAFALLAFVAAMVVPVGWLVLRLVREADPLTKLEREYEPPGPKVLTFGKYRPEPGTKEFEVFLKPGETEIDLNQHYLAGHWSGWVEAFYHWRRYGEFRYRSQDDILQDYSELEPFYPGCWAGYCAARDKIRAAMSADRSGSTRD
jgi:hypothetical protein